MMEEEFNVNYLMVYDKDSNNYYNVEVSYEKADLNGSKREYPVFSNATKLN